MSYFLLRVSDGLLKGGVPSLSSALNVFIDFSFKSFVFCSHRYRKDAGRHFLQLSVD